MVKTNRRLEGLSDYHFIRIQELKEKYISSNSEIFDFSIGDPDFNVDATLINTLVNSLQYSENLKYPPYDGVMTLKNEIIRYYDEVYNVKLGGDEVIILIGSKEGISNIIPSVCNFGDGVILPNPSYPVYEACSKLWGAVPHKIPLSEPLNFMPELSSIPNSVIEKSKLFFINYPNNPTGAIASEAFYKEIIEFCYKFDLVLCNDGAYQEIVNPDINPLSLMQYDYKRKHIEFGSFSKSFNMTGFRLGFAVGNKEIIRALLKVKSNLDSGQFIPIQLAGIQALKEDRVKLYNLKKIYEARKKVAERILDEKKIKYFKGEGTFYIWCKVPNGSSSEKFCEELAEKYKILVTPGEVFGSLGENHFRIALTKDVNVIKKALNMLTIYEQTVL